jgi:hypothetical protein
LSCLRFVVGNFLFSSSNFRSNLVTVASQT